VLFEEIVNRLPFGGAIADGTALAVVGVIVNGRPVIVLRGAGLSGELVRIFMVLSSYPASGLRHAPIARCEQIGCRHAMIMPQVLSARPGAPSRRQQGFESLPDATSFWEVQRRNGFQGDPGSQIAQGTFE
jgi:hypothetical protein